MEHIFVFRDLRNNLKTMWKELLFLSNLSTVMLNAEFGLDLNFCMVPFLNSYMLEITNVINVCGHVKICL